MDAAKLRSWWAHRQGLDGRMAGSPPAAVLAEAGWARSVGGVNPYLTLFSRAGTSREDADAAVKRLEIHELPSARGCTYVLPKQDFALGLLAGQAFGGATEIATARKLGVPDDEIDRLCVKVLEALGSGAIEPAKLKDLLGDSVRNLGEEGKKRGLTTTLPVALGKLQSKGEIRRVPTNGRLDQQRYAYARWEDSPLKGVAMSREDAYAELAKRYFGWIGPATMANFQWFSGLGVGAAKSAIESLGLAPVEPGSDFLIRPEDRLAFEAFAVPKQPAVALIASTDGLLLHRRDVAALLDPSDGSREMMGEKGLETIGGVQDLSNHAIVDRGRLIGLWEYDPASSSIVWTCWSGDRDAVKEAITRTETYVREQLGDARSFSLDSPESRAPKIAALRGA